MLLDSGLIRVPLDLHGLVPGEKNRWARAGLGTWFLRCHGFLAFAKRVGDLGTAEEFRFQPSHPTIRWRPKRIIRPAECWRWVFPEKTWNQKKRAKGWTGWNTWVLNLGNEVTYDMMTDDWLIIYVASNIQVLQSISGAVPDVFEAK